jgi:L-fuconolactonase
MLKIDSHQHFWKFDPVRDSWIDDQMIAIRRDFLPAELESILTGNGFDGCITVQSDQSEKENEFQLANAKQHDFIKGIVGWVDLQSEQIEERLAYYKQFEKMKGFRHVLQGEVQRDFMLRPEFLNGISLLRKYGFTYDILIFPDQLKYTADFVSRFPNQPFVIDHLAKPGIKNHQINEWEKDIRALAKFENVFCKVSGMVTEADWKAWKPEDFHPYLDVLVDAFGVDRLMYGSDWPVCNLAGIYERVVGLVKDYFSTFADAEQQKLFGGNAAKFYTIN